MATRSDYHTWTPAEDARALALYQDDLGYDDIAVDLGVTVGAVKARIEKLLYSGKAKAEVRPHGHVAPELIAERDARKAAYDRRDQTATFCGDPPVGFSALDQRDLR